MNTRPRLVRCVMWATWNNKYRRHSGMGDPCVGRRNGPCTGQIGTCVCICVGYGKVASHRGYYCKGSSWAGSYLSWVAIKLEKANVFTGLAWLSSVNSNSQLGSAWKKNWAGLGSAAPAGSNSWSCRNTRPYLMKKKKKNIREKTYAKRYMKKNMRKNMWEKTYEKKHVRKHLWKKTCEKKHVRKNIWEKTCKKTYEKKNTRKNMWEKTYEKKHARKNI